MAQYFKKFAQINWNAHIEQLMFRPRVNLIWLVKTKHEVTNLDEPT